MLAAIGTTSATFEPDAVDVAMNGVTVCRGGTVGEDRVPRRPVRARLHVLVDLHAGGASATIWTNDLSEDYVHENSAYST